MTTNDAFITLLNLTCPPYKIDPASTIALASGKTAKFQSALVLENTIELEDLTSKTKTEMPLTKSSFISVFASSAAVVIFDSMFARESFIYETDSFLDHGLIPLVDYYNEGQGKVVIHCHEGVYAIGDLLSQTFGCEWKLAGIDSTDCVPTQVGKDMFPNVELPSSYLSGKVHFIKAPTSEGLLVKKLYSSKEEYFDDNGLDPNEEDDHAEESWKDYLSRHCDAFAICVHSNSKGGKLIWNGDRGENEVMKPVFEKLLAI